MTKKIFVIAGEASGDALGGPLMRELKAALGHVEFSGVGGPLMEQEGLESLMPMEELSVMGVWEVMAQLPRLLRLISGMVDEIEKFKPDIVITIDLPDFNFNVASRLKKRGLGIKVVHYVAPTVWAWRPGRAKKISSFLDGLLCLFPFEPAYFTPHGLNARFVGHSLVERSSVYDSASFRAKNGIDPGTVIFGLFLGSRESELKVLSETLKETTMILKENMPDIQVIVPTLPQFEYHVRKVLEDWDCDAIVVSDTELKWDTFAACDVALAVSGTVGLELSYLGVPHVIAYKMHPLSWALVKQMVKVKYAHLANIILDKPVVPEYLQGQCNSLEISKGLLRLLKDETRRKEQAEEFTKLAALLGADGAVRPSQKAAAAVVEMMKASQ